MPHIPTSDGRPAWRAQVLTLFPEMFPGPLGISLAGQAQAAGIWSLDTIQIRDFGLGKHRQVDDTPAGGGAGMVLRADVLGPALDHAQTHSPDAPLIYLSPRGTPLTQSLARDLSAGPGVTLLAGRFEGIDDRVIGARGLKEISIGDYVLAGGEVAAMVLIEACVRLLPGVIGAAESLTSESFETGLLEYPQYTKPRIWEGRSIPDVLLSGDHKKIAEWRDREAERLTRDRRPDLLHRNDQKGS
ncbi:tRNA (guanosine(37)-N1)-methyltransferase TrmD [Hyphomicrobium methylovorum]|uniref:tRNA (guanosine(37)-N1)-methyltransferase TrmD n=1 Tax=Hyphomicrobium methylovorum TaxID=84 RepID=UPI0015E73C0B|nr:tRNA (guanosine(37)-N1)-methyltransferase TrmD [Hyphomicrobium methylovorum]MBA2126232.1 tRNA (guanosine(37)-N1)-methyltransferase TrmD [Hyphomicrobium methylovorum]